MFEIAPPAPDAPDLPQRALCRVQPLWSPRAAMTRLFTPNPNFHQGCGVPGRTPDL